METREFIAPVCNGHLPVKTRNEIKKLLGRMEGRKLRITVTEAKKKRSGQQNAFYFGVVIPLVRQMFTDAGNTISPAETHEFIKAHVWRHVKDVSLPDGEVLEVAASSTGLSTMDWEAKIEQTRAWAAQFDLEIPLPNEATA